MLGVDQLYDGAGKATALQVKVTRSPSEASCDIGLVVINGLTTYEEETQILNRLSYARLSMWISAYLATYLYSALYYVADSGCIIGYYVYT